jgi:hypothetical protein
MTYFLRECVTLKAIQTRQQQILYRQLIQSLKFYITEKESLLKVKKKSIRSYRSSVALNNLSINIMFYLCMVLP